MINIEFWLEINRILKCIFVFVRIILLKWSYMSHEGTLHVPSTQTFLMIQSGRKQWSKLSREKQSNMKKTFWTKSCKTLIFFTFDVSFPKIGALEAWMLLKY